MVRMIGADGAARAEHLLAALLESTSDYIMIADAEGKPLTFNRAYAEGMREALGIEMQPGLQPHTLLEDPDAVACWDGLHCRVLGGERFTVEFPHTFPDGAVRYLSISFNPIRDGDRVVGFCEVSRDVTARVVAETALRESERSLRESQEVAGIGSYVLDIAAGTWTGTPFLGKILGLDPAAEHTVQTWVDVLHPDWRETMQRYFNEEVLGQCRPFDKEYQIVRGDNGATRWVHGLGKLELDAAGRPVRMLGTIRDVTERKELELRIRQKQRMEAIGQLAGGVAHDFNNQLAGIMGYAEVLKDELADEPDLALCAESILLAAERSADLTAQLLAFSRRGKYRQIPVDLHRIIEEAVGILRHTVDKRITITRRLEAEPATTTGDPSQLENAVLNLAINARDAMPEGGEICLTTEVVELDAAACARQPFAMAPGAYVQLCVADTGKGMPPDVCERAFEPFFTTKKHGQGSGMGLAAVYGTVKNHHGSIVIDSEEGSGTRVQVRLPLVPHEDVPETEPEAAASADLREIRVLLVDDEEVVRNVAVRILQRLGCRTTVCDDGAAAVSVYRDAPERFDVVILDMAMPRMDGREAFHRMSRINPDVRVLLASGYSLESEARGILDEGIRGFLQKPFHIDELRQKLGAVVSDMRGTAT